MHPCDLSPLSGSSHRGCRGESQRSCALLDALLNILSHRHVVISSCYYSNCAFREIPENPVSLGWSRFAREGGHHEAHHRRVTHVHQLSAAVPNAGTGSPSHHA